MNTQIILDIRELRTYFSSFDGIAKAVDGISYQLAKGEVLGVVGESGCGKSVTALSVLRLVPMPPGKIMGGEVLFKRQNLLALGEEEMRRIRGNRISMIFQEPMTSLNPVFTLGNQIGEIFRIHKRLSRKESWDRTKEMLKLVNIPSPERAVKLYPHELSGGMRQRVMIAMALACNPEILIADEPTTALDVTIQAQILDLINRLKEEFGMAVVLITHNLGLVAETVNRVIVMYAGKVVEKAETKSLFENPKHPYTIGLLRSIPILGDKFHRGKIRLHEIPGAVPSPYHIHLGCRFSARCSSVMKICKEKEPELKENETGHFSACWLEDQ